MSDETVTRDKIFELLRNAGVASVHAEYDGCGDSGQIDTIVGFTTDNAMITLENIPTDIPIPPAKSWDSRSQCWKETPPSRTQSLMEAIEDFAYGQLEKHFPGWEINDGSRGKFVFIVKDEAIGLEHDTRYTDFETTEMRL